MIGFYVHHHGRGHLRRAAAVIGHLDRPAAVLTELDVATGELPEGTEIVPLPPDASPRGDAGDVTARGSLHWAPHDQQRLAPRTRHIVDWIDTARPDLMVVDVSVEAALVARLCGVPSVGVRLHGERSDRAHRLGYDCAQALWAPFAASLEDPSTPAAVRRRTFYSGAISAHPLAPVPPCPNASRVSVVWGCGGPAPSYDQLVTAARATPDRDWHYLGPSPTGCPAATDNLRIAGWRRDVPSWLVESDVVVGTAGDGTLADVAASGRPLVCLPQDRPHSEQRAKARQLHRRRGAVVHEGWPSPDRWPSLLEGAVELGGHRLRSVLDLDDGHRVATWLAEVAAETP